MSSRRPPWAGLGWGVSGARGPGSLSGRPAPVSPVPRWLPGGAASSGGSRRARGRRLPGRAAPRARRASRGAPDAGCPPPSAAPEPPSVAFGERKGPRTRVTSRNSVIAGGVRGGNRALGPPRRAALGQAEGTALLAWRAEGPHRRSERCVGAGSRPWTGGHWCVSVRWCFKMAICASRRLRDSDTPQQPFQTGSLMLEGAALVVVCLHQSVWIFFPPLDCQCFLALL